MHCAYVAAVVSVQIQNLQAAYLTFRRALARLSSGGEGTGREQRSHEPIQPPLQPQQAQENRGTAGLPRIAAVRAGPK